MSEFYLGMIIGLMTSFSWYIAIRYSKQPTIEVVQ